ARGTRRPAASREDPARHPREQNGVNRSPQQAAVTADGSRPTPSITVFSTPSNRLHILEDRTPYPGSSVSFCRKPKRTCGTACCLHHPCSTTHGSDRGAVKY